MSSTPTAGSAAPNRSGRCVSTAPTSKPPLLRPRIASFGVDVYFSSISHCAAAMKSSNTFCFCSFVPALCHASPYSEPPRRLATAKTPPISSHTSTGTLNAGCCAMLKPP